MNERLPYETQLPAKWDELPLPDENKAWDDMRRRLEEDNDGGAIAWWRRGCVLWGSLLLVFLATGWWWMQSKQNDSNKNQKSNQVIVHENKTGKDDPANVVNPKIKAKDTTGTTGSKELTQSDQGEAGNPINNELINFRPGNRNKKERQEDAVFVTKTGATKRRAQSETKKQQRQPDGVQDEIPGKAVSAVSNNISLTGNENNSTSVSLENIDNKFDSVSIKIQAAPLNEKKSDTVIQKTGNVNEDSSRKKPLFFSIGIAMYQQLPVAGQKFVPYSASGRRGSLGDYIPSVYFRVNRKDKWFVQGEFRYGAPQITKEFVYQQTIVPDTTAGSPFSNITTSKLKKTFYHQLPFSFNYFIRPDWSLGAGIQINRFNAVLSEKEVVKRNNLTLQDSLLSSAIVSSKNDPSGADVSAFKKTYLQAIVETQYKWKRVSLGARYSFGLQPYIKFTLPGGTQQQESNKSLQVFLRYELWRQEP